MFKRSILFWILLLIASAPVLAQGVMPVQPNTVTALHCFPSTTQPKLEGLVIIVNIGNVPIPAGTNLHWSFSRTGYEGDFVLPTVFTAATQRVIVASPAGSGAGFMQVFGGKACVVTIGVPR